MLYVKQSRWIKRLVIGKPHQILAKRTPLTGSNSSEEKIIALTSKDGVWWEENKNSKRKYCMNLIQIVLSNSIALHSNKQCSRSAEVWALNPVFEESATEPRINLLRSKIIGNTSSLNVRTLNTINQLHKHTSSAVEHNIDIICVQDHKYCHSELDLKYHETGG